jgi:hypothetical protein
MHNGPKGETRMVKNTTVNPWETENDAIEQLALEECAKRQRIDRSVSVLILPAGECRLGASFAQLNAQVTVTDDASRQRDIEGRILASGLGKTCALHQPSCPGHRNQRMAHPTTSSSCGGDCVACPMPKARH